MRKRDQKQFQIQANTLIERLGAKPLTGWYFWRLETKVGPLLLWVDDERVLEIGTVFTRFDNPLDANELVNCNPYSGKWNHTYNGGTVEDALEHLEYTLRKVLS